MLGMNSVIYSVIYSTDLYCMLGMNSVIYSVIYSTDLYCICQA